MRAMYWSGVCVLLVGAGCGLDQEGTLFEATVEGGADTADAKVDAAPDVKADSEAGTGGTGGSGGQAGNGGDSGADATGGSSGSGGEAGACTPATETCDGQDNDCNNKVDDLAPQSCYTGPAGTMGVGLCKSGAQTCANGTWGDCIGEVHPKAETCDGVDNDCDGSTDELGAQSCYSGPAGTVNVGICKSGSQTCAGGQWSTCEGEVHPKAETCDGFDNDCSGTADNGCGQVALADDSCYKAVLIVGGAVVGGTDNNDSCSSGPFAATWAPGEVLQIWENDSNISFTAPQAPSLVEWRCSPSNNPPDWPGSLSQSQLGNYQAMAPTVAGNNYTIALTGCTRYLIRITR